MLRSPRDSRVVKPALPMPVSLLMRGRSLRRISNRSSAQPCSSASAALSMAEALPPMTITRLLRSAAKSMSSAVCAQKWRGTGWMKSGMRGWPRPSRPVAITVLRARMVVPSARSSASRLSKGRMHRTSTLILDWQREYPTIPAQIVHPHQARDFVEFLPCFMAELSDEPGAEGERGNARGWSGQHLG